MSVGLRPLTRSQLVNKMAGYFLFLRQDDLYTSWFMYLYTTYISLSTSTRLMDLGPVDDRMYSYAFPPLYLRSMLYEKPVLLFCPGWFPRKY